MSYRWIAATRLTSLLFLLTCSCSVQQTHWTVDAISAGDRMFDSSRLRYASSQEGDHPITFEMVRVGERVDSFISLTRFRLKSNKPTKIVFTIDGQTHSELVPVHEGGMRLTLSEETTQRFIQALHQGHKIAILLDEFEEVLDPSEFSGSFEKFIGETGFFQNFFKGPVP